MQRVLVTFVFLIIFSAFSKSQVKRINYCECKAANTLNKVQYQDSVYAFINSEDSLYVIKIFNTTTDTLFLFSSYLQQQFFSSKYLHRINMKRKQYKMSFVPIVPYVFTKYSDVVATTDILVKDHQVVYDFIKMQPNSYYEFSISFMDAFQRNGIIKDFSPKELNKFDYRTKFKRIYTKSTYINNYRRLFEFALYKDVSSLCKESDYYLRENEFNLQAKSFTILQVPVR